MQNIERQDVGVTLRVTPQISEGDTIRLDIFQEISEVLEDLTTELGPTTSQRSVENTVFVRDGEAVMIGGIISNTQTKIISKVPFLGDVPILGWAFKSESIAIRKVNLLVILTPHIVRDPDDLRRLTVEHREEFRTYSHDALELTDKEKEARQNAIQAGVPLPLDPNPVRRELTVLDGRYPVEDLPRLREERDQRERERKEEMERSSSGPVGAYLVQVALFRDPEQAVTLLEELMASGYDGTLLSRREGDDLFHFVQLGPYSSEDDAQRIVREVRATTGFEAVVILRP